MYAVLKRNVRKGKNGFCEFRVVKFVSGERDKADFDEPRALSD
jgi:hypothetical protein